MTTKKEMLGHYKPLHNHIGIYHDCELARLIGIHRDPMDWYYIVQQLGSAGDEGQISHGSMVGSFISLKDKLSPEDYARMENIFTRNGATPTKKFIATSTKINPWG